MIKLFKKSIFAILAIIVLIYIFVCDVFMTISLSMNLCFLTATVLLLFLQYVVNNPIDYEKNPPSFFHIFIKIASFFFFFSIISVILFNCLYPKNMINPRDQKYDYIIVFGAGITEGKTAIMNSRLDTAIEYANKYKRCKFVLTGAKGGKELIEEAAYMRDYMSKRGVKDSNIIVEPFSVNTNENIFNSLKLIRNDVKKRNARENIITRPFKNQSDKFDLEFLNIGFMSSVFHLTRISLMSKKYGILRPYSIPCETKALYKPYLYVREDLSLFKALVLNQLKF